MTSEQRIIVERIVAAMHTCASAAELAEQASAIEAALNAAREWQPIETAPKDGTEIDLWMVDETGRQWREADAYYVTDREQRTVAYGADGSYSEGAIRREGWWAPNHDYDGNPGWCDVPRHFNPHPRQQKWIFTEPTHWMPLPEPPSR